MEEVGFMQTATTQNKNKSKQTKKQKENKTQSTITIHREKAWIFKLAEKLML